MSKAAETATAVLSDRDEEWLDRAVKLDRHTAKSAFSHTVLSPARL